MKTKIVKIDAMAARCGHFTGKTWMNGGYGCNHPDQEEYEKCYTDSHGRTAYPDEEHPATGKQGKCYSFSCPIANACELEDIKEHAPDLLDDYPSDSACESAQLVVYHYEDGDKIGELL